MYVPFTVISMENYRKGFTFSGKQYWSAWSEKVGWRFHSFILFMYCTTAISTISSTVYMLCYLMPSNGKISSLIKAGLFSSCLYLKSILKTCKICTLFYTLTMHYILRVTHLRIVFWGTETKKKSVCEHPINENNHTAVPYGSLRFTNPLINHTWTVCHFVSTLATSFTLGCGHSSLKSLSDFPKEAGCWFLL